MTIEGAIKKHTYSVVAEGGAFTFYRDDKPMKTPAGALFTLPNQNLARAVAEEWRTFTDETGKIHREHLSITRMAATVIDIISRNPEPVLDQIAAYAGSELLCHRAEYPAALVERQREIWQPVLDTFAGRYNVHLKNGTGLMPVAQTPETLKTIRDTISRYDPYKLVALREAVDLTGSLVLGILFTDRLLMADEALTIAEVEVEFQSKQWGEDPAIVKRRQSVRDELDMCELWLSLL